MPLADDTELHSDRAPAKVHQIWPTVLIESSSILVNLNISSSTQCLMASLLPGLYLGLCLLASAWESSDII